MSLKQFKIVKILIVIALAIIVSQSVVYGNFIIPIMAMAVATAILLLLRNKVKEVVADERDYKIGGKAARLAIQVFSWVAVITMLAFFSQKEAGMVYEAVAMTLAYSICFLMLFYALVFKLYSKK